MFTYTYTKLFTSHTTAITLIQIKAPANNPIEILRASLTQRNITDDDSFDVGLVEKTSAATVTAAVAADFVNHTLGGVDSGVQVGTAASGHTASSEGTDAILPRYGVSVLAGWEWLPTPEERIIVGGGLIVGLKLHSTITSADIIANITFRQLSS